MNSCYTMLQVSDYFETGNISYLCSKMRATAMASYNDLRRILTGTLNLGELFLLHVQRTSTTLLVKAFEFSRMLQILPINFDVEPLVGDTDVRNEVMKAKQ